MANLDTPNGFRPFVQRNGGSVRFSSHHRILGTYGTKIYSGDVVRLANTGYIELASPGDTNLIGVFAGCQYVNALGEFQFSPYWPAPGSVLSGTEVEARVYDDPGLTFIVQTATGTAFTQTMCGNNADFISTHAGSDVYGVGGQELDISAAAAPTANFRIHGLWRALGNALGEHAKVIVSFNEHLNLAAAGI